MPRSSSSQSSHCTDYAIQAPFCDILRTKISYCHIMEDESEKKINKAAIK
jgi:hypothetical protein